MKKVLLAAIVSCLAIAGTVCAAPEIYVEEPIYDFGSILEGFAVTHVFIIQNTGNQTLVIERVAASCGCTTTELATDRLAPGESVELEVLINTAGFAGRISKSITVYTNDPQYGEMPGSDQPKFTLRVTGGVIRAQPYHITSSDMNYLFTLFVDLRDPTAYEETHLIGAINIPAGQLTEELAHLPADAFIVLYDQDGALSKSAAAELDARGYLATYYLHDGLDEWMRWYETFFLETNASVVEIPDREGRNRFECPDRESEEFDPLCSDTVDLRYLVYLLIDLRDPDTYNTSHLFGAINIPHTEISGRLSDLPKDVRIVVYDQANEQSDVVAQMMLDAGFDQARSLLGGLDEWMRQYGERFVLTASASLE